MPSLPGTSGRSLVIRRVTVPICATALLNPRTLLTASNRNKILLFIFGLHSTQIAPRRACCGIRSVPEKNSSFWVDDCLSTSARPDGGLAEGGPPLNAFDE